MENPAENIPQEDDMRPKNKDSKNKEPKIRYYGANSDRRSKKDRRVFKYTIYVPERRSGSDRRGLDWYRNY